MPSPTRSDMHQNTPLQNFSVAAMNDDADFVLLQAAPSMPVDRASDSYYIYDTGAWNRREMRPRGSSEKAAQGGWSLSTTTYRCDRYAVEIPWDYNDVANADAAIDPEADAAKWLAQQAKIQGEYMFGAECFTTGIWTTNRVGASSGVAGTSFLYWDNASGDPQADAQTIHSTIKGLIGKHPNVMVVGDTLHNAIVVNPQVRDAIKYTEPTMIRVVESKLAQYFGVEKYIVASAFYNSAAEGAATVMARILNTDSAWIGYVDPTVGTHVMTACKTFCYNMGGRASQGTYAYSYDDPSRTSTYYGIEWYVDVKTIAVDAGAYLSDLLT